MIPASAGTGPLTALTRDGAAVAVTARTVKGVDYLVFDAAPGAYVATYGDGPALTPTATPTTASQPRDRLAPRVKLLRKRLRVSRRGFAVLRVQCPRGEVRCVVAVKLRRKGKSLARARVVVAGGKTASVRLKLSKAARARLARRGAMKATVTLDARDAAGNRRVTKTKVRLLARRG
jgi:hypothetical protein